MANTAWHIHFEPTIDYLKPAGAGAFSVKTTAPGTKVSPPPGSFPVVSAVRLSITDDAAGPAPIAPGASPLPATIEFVGRAKPATKTSPGSSFISLGTVAGKVSFNTTGKTPRPLFTCNSVKTPGSVLVTLAFTPSTAPEVVHSDWAIPIEKHPDTFDTRVGDSFFIKLPWQFVENPGRMQLSARLTIDGKPAGDETRNTPLDIPLKHASVPEDADTTKKGLTFFGVRNLFTKLNTFPATLKVPIGSNTLSVFLHSSFTAFVAQSTNAKMADIVTNVVAVLNDAGFSKVNVVQGAAADTPFNLHWKSKDGRFMATKIGGPPDPSPKAPPGKSLDEQFAAAISTNNFSLNIPDTMVEEIPFFDFYVGAESADPPNPIELGRSETFLPVTGSVAGVFPKKTAKSVTTPIIISKGTGRSSPLRKHLDQVDKADHANVLASTICHEIGHSFGLRHAVALIDAPPYQLGDGLFSRGVMGASVLAVGAGTPRSELRFFGPVHGAEIKRLYQ